MLKPKQPTGCGTAAPLPKWRLHREDDERGPTTKPRGVLARQSTPTITSEALMTAHAF